MAKTEGEMMDKDKILHILLILPLMGFAAPLQAQDTEPTPTAALTPTPTPTITPEPMSASEVVDGGHVMEGLWEVQLEYILSAACDEAGKRNRRDFYEEMYYNDDGHLVWDAGNNFSSFVFQYLLTRRYTISKDYPDNPNRVVEYEIESATVRAMSGRYTGYWQGHSDSWCSVNGSFTAEFFEGEDACLVQGDANVRAAPSVLSGKRGTLEEQGRPIGKVWGDDNYHWWKLADDRYVREDVVGASRSCAEIEVSERE